MAIIDVHVTQNGLGDTQFAELKQLLVTNQGILLSIQTKVNQLVEGGASMSAALDRLTSEVQQSRDAVQSVITLVGGLADQIRQNAADEGAMNALADELDAQQTQIANAVTANTPASGGGSGSGTGDGEATPPSDG